MMRHHYQPRLKIDRPLLWVKVVINKKKRCLIGFVLFCFVLFCFVLFCFVFFFGNNFVELTLQVCTEEDVYVQRLGFVSQNLLRLWRTLAPSVLDTHASRSWLISHGPC